MHVNFTELYNTAYAEVVNNAAGILATKDRVVERFAELIVQECAKIAADSGDTVTSFCISDYFGVEP